MNSGLPDSPDQQETQLNAKLSAGGLALDPIETASTDELRALQLKRLKASLAHAYENVPFYKASFDRAGIQPQALQSLDDLRHFPFTVKSDLRDNYPFGMFAVPREQVVRIHASSGTTGKPTVVGYTQSDIDMWAGLVARSIRGKTRPDRRALRGRPDRAPGAVAAGLWRQHHHGYAQLYVGHCR